MGTQLYRKFKRTKEKNHAIKPCDSPSNQELNTSQAILVGLVFKHTVKNLSSNKSGEIKPCFQEALTELSMRFSITAKERTCTAKLHLSSGIPRPLDSSKFKTSRTPGGRAPRLHWQYGCLVKERGSFTQQTELSRNYQVSWSSGSSNDSPG